MPTKSKADSIWAISHSAIMLIKGPQKSQDKNVKWDLFWTSMIYCLTWSSSNKPGKKSLGRSGGRMGRTLLAKANLQGPRWDVLGWQMAIPSSLNDGFPQSHPPYFCRYCPGLPGVRQGSRGCFLKLSLFHPPTHPLCEVGLSIKPLTCIKGYFNQHSQEGHHWIYFQDAGECNFASHTLLFMRCCGRSFC